MNYFFSLKVWLINWICNFLGNEYFSISIQSSSVENVNYFSWRNVLGDGLQELEIEGVRRGVAKGWESRLFRGRSIYSS